MDAINSALYLNRAACNLELKNYRRCIEDCKKVLMLDEKNIKACFRSGKAFFAIEKYDEAIKVLEYGLNIEPENKDLQKLLQQVQKRQETLAQIKAKKAQEEEQERLKNIVLENSIKLRHIEIVKSSSPLRSLEDCQDTIGRPQRLSVTINIPCYDTIPHHR